MQGAEVAHAPQTWREKVKREDVNYTESQQVSSPRLLGLKTPYASGPQIDPRRLIRGEWRLRPDGMYKEYTVLESCISIVG